MSPKEQHYPYKQALVKTPISITKMITLPVAGALLVVLSASCEKIEGPKSPGEVVELQSIPLTYGELKSVTLTERYPGWAQLWFQDGSGTISMVRVEWEKHQMIKEHLTISRTQALTERTKP